MNWFVTTFHEMQLSLPSLSFVSKEFQLILILKHMKNQVKLVKSRFTVKPNYPAKNCKKWGGWGPFSTPVKKGYHGVDKVTYSAQNVRK